MSLLSCEACHRLYLGYFMTSDLLDVNTIEFHIDRFEDRLNVHIHVFSFKITYSIYTCTETRLGDFYWFYS